MKPVIDKSKCTNCGKCIEVCPVEHFAKKSNEVVVVKPAQECLGCRACVYSCEQEAIKIEED